MADFVFETKDEDLDYRYELTGLNLGQQSTLLFIGSRLHHKYTIWIHGPFDSATQTYNPNIYLCEEENIWPNNQTLERTFTFTLPLDIAYDYPSGTSIPITIHTEEYNDDDDRIYRADRVVTYTIPENDKTYPSSTVTIADLTECYSTYNSYVKNLSNIRVTLSPKAAYGASIVSVSTRVLMNGDSIGAYSGTVFSFKPPSSGYFVLETTLVDSRGFSKTITGAQNAVLNYDSPIVTKLTVHRCNSSGTEDTQGQYVRVTFSAVVTSLGNNNTATYVLNYKKSSAGDWTGVALDNLTNNYTVTDYIYIFKADTDHSYDVRVTVEDNHYASPRSTSASTSFTMMHFAADGLGMAFGKLSEKSGCIEFGIPICDVHGEFVSVIEGGSGIWSYKKWSNGKVDLWGEYKVTNKACATALGNMYRTAAFTIDAFPFTVTEPKVVASYESPGYGAFLWATSECSTAQPPSYYLIRPTSSTITNGKIIFYVTGRWDGTVG